MSGVCCEVCSGDETLIEELRRMPCAKRSQNLQIKGKRDVSATGILTLKAFFYVRGGLFSVNISDLFKSYTCSACSDMRMR